MKYIRKFFKNIKEIIHPSDVTWKGGKATLKDALIVFVVSLIMALILIGSDALFGTLFRFIV